MTATPPKLAPDAMRDALEKIEAMQVGHAATIARETLAAVRSAPVPPADVAPIEHVQESGVCVGVQPGAGERDEIAGKVQCILANELNIDGDQEIVGAGPASFKIADLFLKGDW